MPSGSTQVTFPTIDGGRAPLSKRQRQAISFFTDAIRDMPEEQATVLIELLFEFRAESYLDRVRPYELPTLKILAEVINGWEPDGVYEFTVAWVSTLVARQDGFDWSDCTPPEKAEHERRIQVEMQRRGVPKPF